MSATITLKIEHPDRGVAEHTVQVDDAGLALALDLIALTRTTAGDTGDMAGCLASIVDAMRGELESYARRRQEAILTEAAATAIADIRV